MRYLYDLHIHSALSPCADREMTPVNIVAYAAAAGLEIIAVSDHNAAGNVRAAVEVGEALDVLVVPAAEIQTNEDVHVLCLFPDADSLEAFISEIPFPDLKNRPDVVGEQLLINSDDEIVGSEERLLLTGALISEVEVRKLALKHGGAAVPAHVDRYYYGMAAVLGAVPEEYRVVEFTGGGDAGEFADRSVLRSSDAHVLADIGKYRSFIDLPEKSASALITVLRGDTERKRND